MSVTSILDTGPLVAFLKRDEEHHAWALDAFKSLPSDGVVTCEAVLCEATFLLSRLPAAIDALFGKLADGSLRLMPLETESDAIHAMMKRYRNLPMSYADGCLVRLSERFPSAVVVTADSDFRTYRRNKRHAIPLVTPLD